LLLFSLLLFAFLFLKVIMTVGGGREFFHFVLPVLAIIATLLVREFRSAHARSLSRVRTLAAMLFPFLSSLTVPVLLFFLWFWWTGALRDLIHALTVLQLRRVHDAQHSPPEPVLALLSILWFVVLTEGARSGSRSAVTWLKILCAVGVLLACA